MLKEVGLRKDSTGFGRTKVMAMESASKLIPAMNRRILESMEFIAEAERRSKNGQYASRLRYAC